MPSGGHNRGMHGFRLRPKPKLDIAKYKKDRKKLEAAHQLENEQAAQRYIDTVIDCDRLLDTLRIYVIDGTITSDERKAIVPLMKERANSLERLGLNELKKKKVSFR